MWLLVCLLGSSNMARLVHGSLGFDYQGIETLEIKPRIGIPLLSFYMYMFIIILRSQCAFHVAPSIVGYLFKMNDLDVVSKTK